MCRGLAQAQMGRAAAVMIWLVGGVVGIGMMRGHAVDDDDDDVLVFLVERHVCPPFAVLVLVPPLLLLKYEDCMLVCFPAHRVPRHAWWHAETTQAHGAYRVWRYVLHAMYAVLPNVAWWGQKGWLWPGEWCCGGSERGGGHMMGTGGCWGWQSPGGV